MESSGSRLRYLRNKLQLPVNQLLITLKIKQGYYSNLENNIRKPSRNILERLRTEYNVSSDWILTGSGSMFLSEPTGSISIVDERYFQTGIVVNIGVNAGGGVPSQDLEVIQKVSIPFIKKNSILFPVHGNSMYPVFENGDWIIITQLENHEQMKSGRPYALKMTDGTYYLKYIDKRGTRWILRSENFNEYKQFEVNFTEIECIYSIDYRLTEHFGWE